MKYYQLALHRFAVVALSGVVLVGSANAASVAMLQFGSFETRDEAQARLDLMKKKHGGVLGSLPSSIREIKLAADDLTVYRTQAGPLPSRAAAQSICAQLASNGDECYVVETSMVAGSPAAPVVPPPTQVAATAPEPPVKLQPIPSRDPSSAAALAQLSAAPSSSEKSSAPTSASSSDSASKSANDAANNDTVKKLVTASPVVVDASPAKPSPQLQAALEKAIAEQEAADKAPKAEEPEAKPLKDTRSFWTRANPFSDDEPEEQPKPVVKKIIPNPQPSPDFPPPPVIVKAESPKTEIPKTEAPVVVVAQNAMPVPAPVKAPLTPPPPAPAAPVAQPVPLAPVDALQSSAKMDLPPPPSPLIPTGPRPLAAVQSMPVQPLKVSPPPATIAPVPAVNALPPLPKPPEPHSNVSVEEAKRVPLTETTLVPPPPEVASVPGPEASSSISPSLMPTSNLGKKTVWAQLGKFSDTQAALAFWDSYRKKHPDFPSVRVRVVSSYQAQQHGDESKWLRVGPFAREAFVVNLCDSADDVDVDVDDLHCGQVMDMGVALSPNRVPGLLPASRYQR